MAEPRIRVAGGPCRGPETPSPHRLIGPLQCGDRSLPSPHRLGVMAERDHGAGVARELGDEPDLDPWACSVEMNECRALCGVTYGKPSRANTGSQ
jgi:hypothetical protein